MSNPFENLPPGTEFDLTQMNDKQLMDFAAKIPLDDQAVAICADELRDSAEKIQDDKEFIWSVIGILRDLGEFTIKMAV